MKQRFSQLNRHALCASSLACALSVVGCGAGGSRDDASASAESLTLSGITLQTVLVPRFVGAANNGGGAVAATATTAQAWETFSLEDINGGTLLSGDSVYIKAGNGQYFQALNGGGSSLNAGSPSTQTWETFKIVKQTGAGALTNGDVVGLQAHSGSYISAANGGGGAVFAYGGSFGTWEQFKIGGLAAVVTPPTTPTSVPTTPPPPVTTPVTIANVSFRTTLLSDYVSATNGGGSTVVATSPSPQTWSLVDVNGGALASGDSVYVKANNGQYLQALNGGGSSLNAGSANTQAWAIANAKH